MPTKKAAHSSNRKKSGASQLHEKLSEAEGHKLAATLQKATHNSKNEKTYVTMPSNRSHKKKPPKPAPEPEVVTQAEKDRLGEELVRAAAHKRALCRE